MVNRIVSVDEDFDLPEAVRGRLTASGERPVGQGELVVNAVDYGADPTGTTNSGAAINAAINAAGTTSGVLIPAGTYLIDETINISTNQTVRGAGRHLTILRRAPGAELFAVVATTDAELSMGETTPDEDNLQSSFNLTDLTIDGNKDAAGDGHGLAMYGMSYYLHNVAVHDTPGMGIWGEGPHGDGHGVGFGIQARWDTIRVAETGDPTCGVLFNGPHDSIIDNLVVKNHVAPVESRTVTYGLLVGPIGYGLHLHDSHIWGINHDYATRWEGGVTATNCQFEGARYAHVWVMSNLCNIFGGKVYTSGGLDSAVGVRLGESGTPATFVSNYNINTSFFDCRGGAVWYDRDGGGTVTAYGAVPSAQSAVSTGYVGQPNRALSHANIRIASAGTNPSIMQFPRGGVGALPAGSPTIDDAAADVSTTTALVNQIRAALVENGLIRITPGGTTPGADTVIAAGPTAADARAAIGAAAEGEGGGGTELTSYVDQVASLSDYPAFVAAGTSQTAARDAIGAGTSSLQLGTGPTTAKAGDYTPTVADVPNLPASKTTTGTFDAARIPTLAQNKVTNLTTDLAAKAATADLAEVATTNDYEDLDNLPELGVVIRGVLGPEETPPAPGIWLRRDAVDELPEPDFTFAGSYVSTADSQTGPITLTETVVPGDIIAVSVHASSNTGTLGCSDAESHTWTAGDLVLTDGSTPHMKVQWFYTVVTTPTATVTVTRSNSGGGLTGHAFVIKGYNGTLGAQAGANDMSDPITFTSVAAPDNSIVLRAVTSQDNQDIGASGVGGSFTLGANEVSSGGSGPRRAIVIYRHVTTGTSVTGNIDMQGASRYVTASLVLT